MNEAKNFANTMRLGAGSIFPLYMSFRAYYIKFGIDSKFWRLD